MKEWDWEANVGLDPNKITCGSGKKAWWICSKGHTYLQRIYQRTAKQGCPYCAGQKILVGFNDLKTENPRLASEWHPTKNGNLKPTDVYVNSRTKVWWQCPIGHEYQAVVRDRTSGTNCPICASRHRTSFPEQAIFYYAKKLWPNTLNKYKDYFKDGMEFDIYIPELKTAIEYDGSAWHKTDSAHKRELRKYEFCKKHKIYLIRVKENTQKIWTDTADKILCVTKTKKRNYFVLKQVICKLLNSTCKIKQEIDIEKDENKILSNYLSKIDNSLKDTRPDVAAKWHPTKNGNLTPDMFTKDSHYEAWWKCPDCGKGWKRKIQGMTQNINGCPVCSKIQIGETKRKISVQQKGSLAEKMPELAKEWHKTRNGSLKPTDVTAGSNEKAWWQCSKCGYEWQTRVVSRGLKHSGCPCCAGQKVLRGVNDLATVHPELVKEWHKTKNGNLRPTDVVAGTHKKVWWKCSKCANEWEAEIVSRVNGRGCSICAKSKKGKSLIKFHAKQKGSLAEKIPELAKEWHRIKNGGLTPRDVTIGSDKRVWWQCLKCENEWQAVVRQRAKGFCKCPKCAKNKNQLEFDFK